MADTSNDRLAFSHAVAAVYHSLDGLCGLASRGAAGLGIEHCLSVLLGSFECSRRESHERSPACAESWRRCTSCRTGCTV